MSSKKIYFITDSSQIVHILFLFDMFSSHNERNQHISLNFGKDSERV